MFIRILLTLSLSVPFLSFAKATQLGDVVEYKLQTIAEFDKVLWGFSFINENEVLVTLRDGELYYFNMQTKEKKKLQSPKVKDSGQGGLLDVHYYPVDGINYVYMTFSEKTDNSYTTTLARGVYKNRSLSQITNIFRAKMKGNSRIHFGSRLVFKDRLIFMTLGERNKRDYAQDLSYHNGKILRLTLEGKPAPGNPFIGDEKALPEIWSYGHRNPQGIDIDPVSKQIYSVEFGPRGGDELNLIKASANYGWPVITYGKEYWGFSIGETHKVGMEQPISYWVPSISPSGMAFYNSDKLPQWKNNLFLACLGGTHLRRLEIKKGKVIKQEKLFASLDERIRHVRTGKDGWLYFSTDSGKLVRVRG